ncbi:MAG: tape measure protein [Chthonomonas sp.]|nr:tape measure protein [Chthonomonas sp.]
MSVVDVLETEFKLSGNYVRESERIKAATAGIGEKLDKLNKTQLIGGLTRSMAVAAGALGAAVVALSANAMRDSAHFDSIIKGLDAIEGGADRARRSVEELKKIAKAPGIGFEEAVTGYSGLRRGGVETSMSMALIREIGNANAMAGGSTEKFDRMMYALTEIAIQGKLQGDELRQLMEAGLPVGKMLKEEFGVGDAEALKKLGLSSDEIFAGLLNQLRKLPRAAGGFQNVLDNLGDSFKFASISVGEGLNEGLMPMLNDFGSEIARLTEDGTLKELGSSMAEATSRIMEAAGGLEGVASSMEIMAKASPDIANNFAAMAEWAQRFMHPEQSDMWTRGIDPLALKWWEWFGIGKGGGGENADATIAEMEGYRGKDGKRKTVRERIAEKKAEEAERDKLKADEAQKKEESAKKQDPAVALLRKIEENTKVLPQFERIILGSRGEYGAEGLTSHDITRGQRQSRRVAREIAALAADIAAPMKRLTQR